MSSSDKTKERSRHRVQNLDAASGMQNAVYNYEASLEIDDKADSLKNIDNGLFKHFLFYWGIIFVVTTTLVMVLKKENLRHASLQHVAQQGIKETYKSLICIIRMPAILNFCILLLTSKIGFSAVDVVTGLKLIEMGVPKEQLALLAVPMVPLQILLPLAISKYTAGQKPLNVFYRAMPFRLAMGVLFALLVVWTPMVKEGTEFPMYYYGVLLFSYALHQVAVYSMYVAVMAFNAKISDPSIGGTYMTLLNTISNLAGNWPATLALWLVDPLTIKKCSGVPEQSCRSAVDSELCVKSGGSCSTISDGYYVESICCFLFGLLWWLRYGNKFRNLQDEQPTTWQCKRNN
ncbi:acetyl-coenzyme A transporter 1 isoform X2 [Narcine bancroftii]|uniref:acetyl-coenzyme A transporter 1 isoform X2 n=1 Tax=Narcine bancroftii TaxID=1343680 RepID=UPI0038314F71